jgi:four helix bundle protein
MIGMKDNTSFRPDSPTERQPAKSFEDLVVWQKAHQLVLAIYRVTRGFPLDERFGLSSQLRRAASSITANIAEGFRRDSSRDKARILNIAEGSLAETHNFLILARDLGYIAADFGGDEVIQVGRLLNSYRQAIVRNIRRAGRTRR